MVTCFSVLDLVVFNVLSDPLMSLFGYLDPGAGSMLLQVIIAGFFSIVVMLRVYWQAVVDFFRSILNSKATDETDSGEKFVESGEQVEEKVDKKAA